METVATIRPILRLAFALLLFSSCFYGVRAAFASVTKEQRAEINALVDIAKKTEVLAKKGEIKQAADNVRELLPRYDKLAVVNDKDVQKALEPLYSRLNRIYGVLELEGEVLPPLKKPGASDAPTASTVSFTKEVAPLLVQKCGRCHVSAARGRFQMRDFEELMKGPPEGVVVMPGNADGSRIVEVIVSGDMPRGGDPVSEEELGKLKTWIAEGAKFDGPDAKAPLRSFAAEAGGMAAASTLNRPTGKETVSFALDLAPVLSKECLSCHGQQNPRGQFSMVTFERFLRGGDSGGPFVAKKPEESLLVKKLKGVAGDRMPLGRPALSNEIIKKFETWIAEGAAFDGRAANRDFDFIHLAAKSEKASHEELTEQRKARSLQTWRTVIPNSQPEIVETEQFLVLGNIGKIPLEELAQRAQAMTSKIASAMHAGGGPLVKGKITLYVFSRRYDYSEFGQLIERRELPRHWQGHSRADGVDAYGVIYLSPDAEPLATDALLAEQIAGAYAHSLPSTPNWFTTGFGKAISSKLYNKNPQLSDWENAVAAAMTQMKAPDDFIAQRTSPEAQEAASYSFVRFLMTNSKGYSSLMSALRKGTDFSTAFTAAYRSTPAQLTQAWAPNAVRVVKAGK